MFRDLSMSASSSRRDGLRIEARCPVKGTITVQIKYQQIMKLKSRSLGQVYECRDLVPWTLQNAFEVYEGIRSDEDEDPNGAGWRCYAGRPHFAYRQDGEKRDPWPGEVFLVFVNDEGVAYNWRWEPTDENGYPQDNSTRFRRPLS